MGIRVEGLEFRVETTVRSQGRRFIHIYSNRRCVYICAFVSTHACAHPHALSQIRGRGGENQSELNTTAAGSVSVLGREGENQSESDTTASSSPATSSPFSRRSTKVAEPFCSCSVLACVLGSVFEVSGSGFEVSGSGCRIRGSG